jgi:hypothetical protein
MKFRQPSLGTKAAIFLPFLISWTRAHLRMAELGCLASMPLRRGWVVVVGGEGRGRGRERLTAAAAAARECERVAARARKSPHGAALFHKNRRTSSPGRCPWRARRRRTVWGWGWGGGVTGVSASGQSQPTADKGKTLRRTQGRASSPSSLLPRVFCMALHVWGGEGLGSQARHSIPPYPQQKKQTKTHRLLVLGPQVRLLVVLVRPQLLAPVVAQLAAGADTTSFTVGGREERDGFL